MSVDRNKLWTKFRQGLRANVSLLIMVGLVVAGRSSLADHYVVPSGSMEPTLMPGDRVLVDKRAFGLRVPFTDFVLRGEDSPRAGDVVIFDSPENGTRLIKRVAAVAGDTVEVRNGRLRVNDRELAAPGDPDEERFGDQPVRLGLAYGGGPDLGPVQVPAGHLIMLGDSRGNSRDSRFFGFVRIDGVYARAERVYFRSDEGFVWLPL